MSIHPYIHPVNSNENHFLLVSDHSQVNQCSSWCCELLTKIGIPADSARNYAKTFMEESITKDSLTMIDREVLKELGVTTMGHVLAILKLAKEQPLISDSHTKAPAVKLPQLHSGMTSQQFRKFRIDWEVLCE